GQTRQPSRGGGSRARAAAAPPPARHAAAAWPGRDRRGRDRRDQRSPRPDQPRRRARRRRCAGRVRGGARGCCARELHRSRPRDPSRGDRCDGRGRCRADGAAVWMAIARLPLPVGAVIATATTAGIALAEALAGSSASVVLAAVLLCVLLALVAYFIKQARASQNTTELLLAQLEDAREEQLRAAAISERSRIASELHDVLAHALSGAAIQLQGARKLAEHEQASAQI